VTPRNVKRDSTPIESPKVVETGRWLSMAHGLWEEKRKTGGTEVRINQGHVENRLDREDSNEDKRGSGKRVLNSRLFQPGETRKKKKKEGEKQNSGAERKEDRLQRCCQREIADMLIKSSPCIGRNYKKQSCH